LNDRRLRGHEPDEPRQLPSGLWARLREDPVRAPEHLALAAAQRHGPAAAAWLAERRAFYAYGPAGLARMAVKRHVTLARFGGAATGWGGLTTLIPNLAALAWIQSRMVFFIAAAYGYDPCDPMRPAELLVLQDVYPDPAAARRALDGAGTSLAVAWAGNWLSREEELYRRLARMAGRAAAKPLLGRAIPGFAVAVSAIGNARRTRALGERAIGFYGG
jgi:EcsC protein family